jgi:hypothetical protein
MPEPFESLRERLLRSGVAPVHVRRYLGELNDHLADLADEETKAGRTALEVKAAARTRLGGDEALAGAMLAQPSLRSWTGRAPWATLVIGPFLLVILTWLVAALGIVAVLLLSPRQGVYHIPLPWLPAFATALFDLAQFAAPLLIGVGVAVLAARQRTHPLWPLVGCLVIALFGNSLFWVAQWPTNAPHDPRAHDVSLSVGVRGAPHIFLPGGTFNFADWSHGLPLVALSLAVAAAVYWWTLHRRSPAAV